jgi:hypothetical protein
MENTINPATIDSSGIPNELPSVPLALAALFATDTITGDYKWKADCLDEDGCLAVAILRDNEDGPVDKEGRRPLTSATLTRSLSERFLAACGETIFKHRTRLAIEIRTENFAADLATGVGRRGTNKGNFIGQGIDINP